MKVTTLQSARFFRIALITSPLFGLFGSSPGFVIDSIEIQKIFTRFLFTTCIALALWLVNIALLRWKDRPIFQRTPWLRYLISVIIGAGIAFLASLIFRAIVPPPEHGPRILEAISRNGGAPPFRKNGPGHLFLLPFLQTQTINLIITFILELFLLRDKKQRFEIENANLLMYNLEARHHLLKKQLQPHFLFNSLSVLRSLITRSPEKAEEYVDKLSAVLRNSIKHHRHSVVPLRAEIDLCLNYLDLQKTRFGDALNFAIHIPESLMDETCVPVDAVQLLIENAIKHNSLTAESPLDISIIGNEQRRELKVINNIQQLSVAGISEGIGLQNLRERYEVLTEEAVTIRQQDESFAVTLKLLPHAYSDH